MKVLLINGSPHATGNTYTALNHMAETLRSEGLEAEILHIGMRAVQGCIGCFSCAETGHCAFGDPLYTMFEAKIRECDALVVGSPVYYAGPNGSLCALLDRLFFASGRHLQYKPATAVAVCRRGGATATLDRLNKYFTINNMPVVSSQYWNMAHGRTPGEVTEDGEGMQTLRTLARNMAWMLRKIAADGTPAPAPEERIATNFIR
ncbi:MAG: flavodoxin family protein [Alistipes sp.]|nr:flavodoxin family protein [Alistipes sp.]